MCLTNNVSSVYEILKSGKKEITAFKVLKRVIRHYNINPRKRYTIYYKAPYRDFSYKSGWVKSDAYDTDLCATHGNIHHGIHVFKTIEDAKDYFGYHWVGNKSNMGHVIIPVTCFVKDLIGANDEEMVFSKIKVKLPADNGKKEEKDGIDSNYDC